MALCEEETTIYRIETEDGTGAYRHAWGEQPSEIRHPSPLEDSELGHSPWAFGSEEWYFGFRSPEQLLFWFYDKDWLEMMDDAGLKLARYKVPAGYAKVSNAQAVFLRANAALIDRTSLLDLKQAS